MPSSDGPATPEAPKPNLRRAVVFCTIFTLVLGGIVYYLWTQHAYLKWRFAGGDVHLMPDALAAGRVSPEQIVTLVNSGATDEVRIEAVRIVLQSKRFRRPYDDRTVAAIAEFAANLPAYKPPLPDPTETLVALVFLSKQARLIAKTVEVLAHNRDPEVRRCVVIWIGISFKGPLPGWTESVLPGLLASADPEVRRIAEEGKRLSELQKADREEARERSSGDK